MKILKLDIKVPFWCSFAEYGTLNIQQTYLFPPPPALFGMILNAMGKPAVHTISIDDAAQKIEKQYLDAYSKLRFSIIIREHGNRIDDYVNILKGNREIDTLIRNIKKRKKKSENLKQIKLTESDIKPILLNLFNKETNYDAVEDQLKQKFPSNENISELLQIIKEECPLSEIQRYNVNKSWMRSQIHRQRIIHPQYTVYIQSLDDEGNFSLEKISSSLRNPKRPLYLGESDDLIQLDINGDGIVDVENEQILSNQIKSIIPGPRVYENCQITKIPNKLRYDTSNNQKLICSIPNSKGVLKESIPCISVSGENIVFL